MKCPICKKEVEPGSRYAPFCSERCRVIDLANWADEKYRIPAPPEPDEGQEQEREDKQDREK